jgi:V-ATPase subunit C
MTKDLGDIVEADDFVLGSEYLQTVVVVIPKYVHTLESSAQRT